MELKTNPSRKKELLEPVAKQFIQNYYKRFGALPEVAVMSESVEKLKPKQKETFIMDTLSNWHMPDIVTFQKLVNQISLQLKDEKKTAKKK